MSEEHNTAPHGLKRGYDPDFTTDDSYRDRLPDTQNAHSEEIKGAPVLVNQVGASNFRLPLPIQTEGGDPVLLETSVTGTVRLEAGIRGINMSRIMRAFYQFKDTAFSFDTLEPVLVRIREAVRSPEARLRLGFAYPILQRSLRSGLEGYQYYDTVLEGVLNDRGYRRRLQFDYVYSSACPGSADLADHAEATRGVYSIPHSQRSRARISVELETGASLSIEELQRLCLRALGTEVQVMVRREDEQAFAELNGAYTKFVEDAARLLFEQLDLRKDIRDFQIVCVHLESLHSHDAVAVAVKGVEGGYTPEFEDFGSLVC